MDVYPYHPKGYCGVDKIGRPIWIEQSGILNANPIFEICDDEYLYKTFYL